MSSVWPLLGQYKKFISSQSTNARTPTTVLSSFRILKNLNSDKKISRFDSSVLESQKAKKRPLYSDFLLRFKTGFRRKKNPELLNLRERTTFLSVKVRQFSRLSK